MKKLIKTIDCTPTWISLIPAMLAVVTDGETFAAKKEMTKQFEIMAKAADLWNEHAKATKLEKPKLETAQETLNFIKGWLNNDEKVLVDLADMMAAMGENCTHALAIKLLIGKIDQSL